MTLMILYHNEEWGVPVHDDKNCSSSSSWKAHRQGSPGRLYLTNGKITAKLSVALTPLRLLAIMMRTPHVFSPIRASFAIT
jgi:hypothetical protein